MLKLPLVAFILVLVLVQPNLHAQTGTIKGRVYNSINNDPVPFASIAIEGTSIGTISDESGNYELNNLKPGTYNILCSFIGFKRLIIYEARVSSGRTTQLNLALVEQSKILEEIEVTASPFNTTEESPLSMQTISSSEIYRNPGGNRDISKVIQILPGVASSASFRNDIIVRGGAPNENRFYLDGIEVPNINHFATQGSSGGPVGMINVNFIREVDFYSGAFPANRGNSLSSIMEFKQIEGNNESLNGTFMLGSSDAGITLDGPLGEKSNFILSARQSYLQFLFKALALPFLPTYNDFQYKQSISVNNKNKITIIGLGAIDDFELNKSVNDDLNDPETIERNEYLLRNLPVNTQWNYAAGVDWKHFSKNSYQNVVISRNHLNNSAVKYLNNQEQAQFLLLDYNSAEIENKIRVENTWRKKAWKWNMGLGYERAKYTNSTFNKTTVNEKLFVVDFNSVLNINKYSLFSQISKEVFSNKLLLSFGVRSDFNDYSSSMSNPLEQLSPRFSASYRLTEKLNASASIAKYFQLPSYTVLGYRDSSNVLVNQQNDISHIQSNHYVVGLEYYPTNLAKVSLEGFYKQYNNYPFLLRDSISLANLGGDFGVIGNEPATSTSTGRSYGMELLIQQKLSSSIYGILSYTLVRSEFSNKNGELIPSAWDNRHVLNLTAGKKFKKDWEIGLKFRYLGGTPFTPYDLETTALKEVWDVRQQGVFDWNRQNENRLPASHGLDLRVDKKWFFNTWSINTYIDIQNAYNFQASAQSYIDVVRDTNGDPVTDPSDSNSYLLKEIKNVNGTVIPSLGLMIEF